MSVALSYSNQMQEELLLDLASQLPKRGGDVTFVATVQKLELTVDKMLAEMTMEQLLRERDSAHEARMNADYIDGLAAWRSAADAADLRMKAVTTEIGRRGQNG